MVRQPLNVELAAVSKVASNLGLGQVTPELLHLGNHTSAKLAPWPIVARIASGTSFDYGDGSIERELKIATHLASRNAPSIRPAEMVQPGPHFESGCAITFWAFVAGTPIATARDEHLAAAALRRLHDALTEVPAILPSFMEKISSCESILENCGTSPNLAASDRLFLQKVYQRLRLDLEAVAGTGRPIHGDSHLGNAILTGSGAVWMDLESVCVGPIEWDISFLPSATWSDFVDADKALIGTLAAARSLCVATWCWAEFGRSPATNEAAVHHLAKLRLRFESPA